MRGGRERESPAEKVSIAAECRPRGVRGVHGVHGVHGLRHQRSALQRLEERRKRPAVGGAAVPCVGQA